MAVADELASAWVAGASSESRRSSEITEKKAASIRNCVSTASVFSPESGEII